MTTHAARGTTAAAATGIALALLAGCAAVPKPMPSVATSAPAAVAPPVRPSGKLTLDGSAVQGGLLTGRVPAGTLTLSFDGKAVPVASDGRFVIAFDRDAGPQARLQASLDSGTLVSETLNVAPREWQIERLDSLPRISQPTAEFERLRGPELALISAARQQENGSDGWRQRFIWPVTGRISGLFGSQRVYRGEPGSYHSGVDVARPAGTPIVAPADGVVILAADRPFTLEGNLLMIDHGMGLNSAFLHLSRIDVKPGNRVRQGQVLGAIGQTGRATGPHLHWSMKWRDARIDPLLIAGPMPGGLPVLTTSSE